MTAVSGQTSPSSLTEPLQHEPLHIFYNATLRSEIEPLNVLIAQVLKCRCECLVILLYQFGVCFCVTVAVTVTSRNQMSVTLKMYLDILC